ncbi:MAG: Rrf2 family transcriptional regulator [Burkholderiales bacterium]
MKLQQNTRLALFSMLEFAADPKRQIPAAEIAKKYAVSSHHLAKVLAELSRVGMVQSVRGVGGGYRFTGNARRLTLMDVISLFEDVLHTETGQSEDTPVGQALASVLSEIDEIAKASMSSITLATMLRTIERQQAASTAPTPPKK